MRPSEKGYITMTLLYIFSFLWLLWCGLSMEAGKMEELVREEQNFVATQYASEGGLSWFSSYANHLPLEQRKKLAYDREHFTFTLGEHTVKVFSREAQISPSYKRLLVISKAVDHRNRYIAETYAVYALQENNFWQMVYIGKGKKPEW